MESRPPVHGETTPLGVFADKDKVLLYHTLPQEGYFQADISTDAFTFASHSSNAKIVDEKRRKVNPLKCHDFRISSIGGKYVMVYKFTKEKVSSLFVATSKDLIRWARTGKIAITNETGVLVPDYHYQDNYVLYFGERAINVAFSKDLTNWEKDETPVIAEHQDFYGAWSVKIANSYVIDEGILVLYYVIKGDHHVAIHAALFDKNNPKQLIRQFPDAIWESPKEWAEKRTFPMGVVMLESTLISYWISDTEGLFAIPHLLPGLGADSKRKMPAFFLNKLKDNPIIKPIVDHFWESRATFNPAAIYEKGKVHLIYRAIGDSDVSVMGYASSSDGVHFDRDDEPVYTPTQPFESSGPYSKDANYSPWSSGGGCYGGCEDPRIAKIDDKLYMTYVAYDGWNPPRVALTSISRDDFLSKKWKWKTPVLISKPGEVNKNACILPEKINGKYAVFHRVFPNILIDYVDDLDFDGKTRWLEGHARISPRRGYWDSRKVGVGATPIKTEDGWLLIYQAVGDQDPFRYKMGAMLLDFNDPSHVLHRSNTPILEPNEWYENEGYKAGVAYPCGAVAFENNLNVYYGGADSVVCVAQAPLDKFLDHLKTTEEASLTPLDSRIVIH
jgi:beta-1,2-mannobiose phosphorylase / 1,2-beta-oligomannan phosphorylase